MRRIGVAVAVVIFAAALAGLLWLTAYFIAPPLFGALWRGTATPWTARLLAALPAVIVGLPFGFAFGLLPWRRWAAPAVVVALLAAGIDLATVVRSRIDPTSAQGRVYLVADALFIVLFVVAAFVGRHSARHASAAQRAWRGVWAWLLLAVAICGAAAWSWARVMPHGVA